MAKMAENYQLAHYQEAMFMEDPAENFIPIAIGSFAPDGKDEPRHPTGQQ